MKKSILIIASLLLITGLQARNHDIKILPERAQSFIVKSFPDKQIRYIEAERDFDDPLTYEVNFTDGVEVEFDKNGKWLKIDCKRTPVPLSIIPADIQSYIAAKAPQGSFVTEIERIRGGYEVELNDGYDYYLTENGAPIHRRR
jgi:hypothetical protein